MIYVFVKFGHAGEEMVQFSVEETELSLIERVTFE